MAINEREFRDALGQFATGVAVVTSELDGVRMGMTVTSFNAVSLSPPLVLFSIARNAQSFDLWHRTTAFAVTVLREGQSSLSNKFARAGGNKWHDVDVAKGVTGSPLLPECLVCFECMVHARHDGGDHEIVVGHVIRLGLDARHSPGPLLFYGGRYRALSTEGGYGTGPGDTWLHAW